MKLRYIILGVLVLLVAGGIGVTALAADTAATTGPLVGDFTGGNNGPLRRLFSGQVGRLLTLRSELNLTADQKKQIRQIVQSHKSEITAVVTPIVQKRRTLRDLTINSPGDESAIRSAANDLGKSIGDAAVLAAKIRGEVRSVLTPTQMQKVEEFRKQSDAAVDKAIGEFGAA